MMTEIIYASDINSEKKITILEGFFTPGETDIIKIIDNLQYIPGIGKEFKSTAENFEKKQKSLSNSHSDSTAK